MHKKLMRNSKNLQHIQYPRLLSNMKHIEINKIDDVSVCLFFIKKKKYIIKGTFIP